MIAKIHNIRAIGKFHDFSPCEPVQLGELTLIYSDNGRGKSTLADIFRALTLGDSKRMVGRKTFRCDFDQLVKLELADEEQLIFANYAWHGQSQDALVFDDVFISENVCAGNMVGSNQYRNLAQVVIGESAVRAQETEDKLKLDRDSAKAEKEKLQEEIRDHILILDGASVGDSQVDEFVELPYESDLDVSIEQQDARVAEVERSAELLNADQFSLVTLPTLPLEELRDLLGQSLEHVEQNAELQVREHLSRFSSGGVEDWLERGTQLVAEQSEFCPFCGQQLSGSHIIHQYQSYFNQEYVRLKEEITDFAGQQLDFESAINQLYRDLVDNAPVVQFWREQNLESELENLHHEDVKGALDVVLSQLIDLLTIKKNSPLEPLQLNESNVAGLIHWNFVAKKVENYNKEVKTANEEIGKRRENLRSADLSAENRKRIRMRNIKRRYLPDVADLCERYKQAKLKLQDYERQIQLTREEINKAIDDLFVTYKTKVNRILESLGADFTIGEFTRTRDKKSVRLNRYGLVISGERVDVGTQDTPVDEASFKNTISAGDRRTLAFAYFLAQVKALPELDNTIIVFDDPLTSLDTNRRAKTITAIRNLLPDVSKQVIVMSHDAFFLHEFWDGISESKRQDLETGFLKICSAPGENEPSKLVDEWDIESEVRDREAKNFKRVVDFVERRSTESDMEDISRCARILLERRCRMLYIDVCQNASTLGSFMECVVQTRSNSPELSNFYQKVKDKINFLNPGLHDDLTARPEPSETETRDYCRDVLQILGRL